MARGRDGVSGAEEGAADSEDELRLELSVLDRARRGPEAASAVADTMASATDDRTEREDALLSIDDGGEPILSLTSAGSAKERGGLMRDTCEANECAAGAVGAAKAGCGAAWGSPAKSSLTCSRQKSSAGAAPTDSVRSRAITHLHAVTKRWNTIAFESHARSTYSQSGKPMSSNCLKNDIGTRARRARQESASAGGISAKITGELLDSAMCWTRSTGCNAGVSAL